MATVVAVAVATVGDPLPNLLKNVRNAVNNEEVALEDDPTSRTLCSTTICLRAENAIMALSRPLIPNEGAKDAEPAPDTCVVCAERVVLGEESVVHHAVYRLVLVVLQILGELVVLV